MRNKITLQIGFIVLSCILNLTLFAAKINDPDQVGVSITDQSANLCFTENKGQVADQNFKARQDVLFSGTDKKLVYHLRNTGISYQLYKVDSWKEIEDKKTKVKRKEPAKMTIYRVDIDWLNANSKSIITKDKMIEGSSNYYLAQCSTGVLNVKSYNEINYQSIYPGIDLKWYQHAGHLKYDYLVAAGANYKQIKFQISGAEKISINNKGDLIIKTPLGEIREEAPVVLQNGKVLQSKWLIVNNTVGFEIEQLDPNVEFIIDPLVRNWATYYGSSSGDYGNSCTTDKSGNVYLSGWTDSNLGTVMATTGSHQSTLGGQTDAFLVKFNSLGQRQWATYYGGSGIESNVSCATDRSENVFLTGFTSSSSTNVIATVGSHQTVLSGQTDAFLTKFNSLGQRQWGTYYGGSQDESALSCATDSLGNVYMCGWTVPVLAYTGTAIATSASHQSLQGGGSFDAFLVKFNSVGTRLWASYYGGSDADMGYSCTTDVNGNVYMCGFSNSITGTIIATPGSHQATSIFADAYLVKFNSSGQRLWGTYYGGDSGGEEAWSCTTDLLGNVFIVGSTNHGTSDTAIASNGAHQVNFAGGNVDAYIAKFNGSGIRQWGTYYGGYLTDYAYSCATTVSGDVYLAGYTTSDTGSVISTLASYQINSGGFGDAYLVKFNSNGQRQWGTYYGGIAYEWAYSCATYSDGSVYIAGYTDSDELANGTVIASTGSHQSAYGGSFDGFMVRFTDCLIPLAPVNTSAPSNLFICTGMNTTVSASASGTINWYASPSGGSSIGSGNFLITPVLTISTSYFAENVTCQESANRTVITVTVDACLGIMSSTETGAGILVYPNPNSGEFILESPQVMEISILNTLGQIIVYQQVVNGKNKIDLNDQPEGIYFIQIRNTATMIKIIKQ